MLTYDDVMNLNDSPSVMDPASASYRVSMPTLIASAEVMSCSIKPPNTAMVSFILIALALADNQLFFVSQPQQCLSTQEFVFRTTFRFSMLLHGTDICNKLVQFALPASTVVFTCFMLLLQFGLCVL